MHKKEQSGSLNEICICEDAPNIHHLPFANDSFLFEKAIIDECVMIQRILDIYSQASGQAVHFLKSSVAFSANTGAREQISIAGFLRVELVERHERYLGLPTFVGKNNKQTVAFIKE